MKKILFSIAGLCLASQALGSNRMLDSTLFISKDGLEVVDGSVPLNFKCGSEWAAVFTDNGSTVTLNTIDGHWTLTGLSSDVAVAAVGEGAPLVTAVAGAVGVTDVEGATTQTLALANQLASAIGSPGFDMALTMAVGTVNDVLDDHGIHPADFNDEILSAIAHLGPSGAVVDASDVTVEDVHREATKTIGLVLNALASSGVIAGFPAIPADLPIDIPVTLPADIPADIPVDIPVTIPADIPKDIPVALPAGVDAAALAAYAAAGGH